MGFREGESLSRMNRKTEGIGVAGQDNHVIGKDINSRNPDFCVEKNDFVQ